MNKNKNSKEFINQSSIAFDDFNSRFLDEESFNNLESHGDNTNEEDVSLLRRCESNDNVFVLFWVLDASHITYVMCIETHNQVVLSYTQYKSAMNENIKPVISIILNLSDQPLNFSTNIIAYTRTFDAKTSLATTHETRVFDPRNLSDGDFDKFNTDIGAVLGCIKHQNDDDLSFLKNERYKNLDEDTVDYILELTDIDINNMY